MSNNFKQRMNDNTELERAKKQAEKRRSKSEKGIDIYAYVLSAICDVIALIFFIYNSPLLGVIFLCISSLLMLVVYLSKRVERKEQEGKSDSDKK